MAEADCSSKEARALLLLDDWKDTVGRAVGSVAKMIPGSDVAWKFAKPYAAELAKKYLIPS